jgi:hypothetical protein
MRGGIASISFRASSGNDFIVCHKQNLPDLGIVISDLPAS